MAGSALGAQQQPMISVGMVSRFSINQGIGAGLLLGYYHPIGQLSWCGGTLEYNQLIGAWNRERRFLFDLTLRRRATHQRLVQWYYEGGLSALRQTYLNYSFEKELIREHYLGVVTCIGFNMEISDRMNLGVQLRTRALYNKKGPVVQMAPMADISYRF
jgi:hypothetical protein